MHIPESYKALLIFLVASFFISCTGNELNNGEDPFNLFVEITLTEADGVVLIQAAAENSIEYQLWIGASDHAEETNTTGTFEYTFSQPGMYTIEVRAYGASGRYIKESRSVIIEPEDDVSLEDGFYTPLSYQGYNLVWNDEFDGSEIDPAKWVFETGTGCPNICGWGNNELQYYREENARVEEGALIIETREEDYSGSDYTSTRMKTQRKRSFQYGRIDIRALLPEGQGIWPALWMLGDNITSVGWPACGEIDIMEMIGGNDRENQIHGTLHWNDNGHVYTGGTYTLTNGVFADEYHVFTIIWDERSIQWLVNDQKFHEIDITPSHMTEFHERFFFIFNVAVGGNWPGSPDETTVFPQQMKVDYIRVFQRN